MPLHALAAPLLLLAAAADPPDGEPPACVGFHMITFESGSAVLTPPARGMVEGFLSLVARSGFTSRVQLTANADRVGSAAYNLRLSRRRARVVRDLLIARGVRPSLIEVEAAGETRPLVETPDGTPELQNRYVQIFEIPTAAEWARREAWWARHGRPKIVC